MKQCLKITFVLPKPDNILNGVLQEQARKLGVEGVGQMLDDQKAEIIACGLRHAIEQLVDVIYKGSPKVKPENIEVEPFISERDFRGVFRIIE